MISATLAATIGFLQHRPGDLVKERYEVLSHLGGGNFGSVYRVRDNVVGNILACKEMHVINNPDTPVDERAAALDLFKREALTLATLRHPHIPSAYFEQQEGLWQVCPRCGFAYEGANFCPEHGARLIEIDQRYYLMMDFVDGLTLEEVAHDHFRDHGRPLPEESSLEWIAQVGSALRSLHKLGIVHRDIKPDNIKVRNSDGAAILLDFGLTKKVEEAGGYGTARLTGTGRFGTPGYAPPSPEEQQNPESRSDIYALGMTLYRLVSARDPQDEAQLDEMRAHSPRHFNVQLRPEIDRIVREATATLKTARYQQIDDFLADINELRAPQSSMMKVPPFTFADGSRARNAVDLARIIETHAPEAQNYLFNGMFGAWLMQNGFAASSKAAEDAVNFFPDKPARGLEIFRRSLYPSGTASILPRIEVQPPTLSFGTLESGEKAIAQLHLRNAGPGFAWGGASIEKTAGADGHHAALPGIMVQSEWEGNLTIPVTLDTGKVGSGGYSGSLLITCNDQQVRVPIDYTVKPLQLKTEPESLDFGTLQVGAKVVRTLKVLRASDESKGVPRGAIFAGASLAGLELPERFSGEGAIEVVLQGANPSVIATSYDGAIQLDTNGGRLRVPVRYTFSLPATRLLLLVFGSGSVGLAAAAFVRYCYFIVNPDYSLGWLVDGHGSLTPYDMRTVGPIVLGACAGLYGASMLGRSGALARTGALAPRIRKNWGNALPLAGLLLGALLGSPVVQAFHFAVWGLGDWLLHPVALAAREPLALQYAPVAWGAAGGIIGIALGLGRVFESVGLKGGKYAMYALLALGSLVVLINAMVSS